MSPILAIYNALRCICGFICFSVRTEVISLNSFNHLMFVMVKSGVFFEVRTEFLNII
jgi:hypothetical protein